MLEVGEIGLETRERARHRPRHAQLLRAGRHLDGTDALGNELGPARESGEAHAVAREAGEVVEEILDVRLVAGPLAPQDVGVDENQRGHPSASR